jgi:mono/diheme cytochrome c family protein
VAEVRAEAVEEVTRAPAEDFAMTKLPRLASALLVLGLAVPAAAQPAPEPLRGDARNGARRYQLHCAACHGQGADGKGPLGAGLSPKPSDLRDAAWLWSKTEDEIAAFIGGAAAPKGGPPMHGRGLTALDVRDVLAWLQEPVPMVRDFFAGGSDYIAHRHVIDQFGLERAENVLGKPLADGEQVIMIYTVFKPDEPAEGQAKPALPARARLIPELPIKLYEAKPRRKIGFLGFVPLELEGGTIQVGLAMNRMMKVFEIKTVPAGDPKTEALRQKLDPVIRSYVGMGGRAEKNPVAPGKGMKATPDLQKAMEKAYVRVLEGAAMYEKEERDRFWADPDAFKFPGAAEMEEVKFEFKEKKKK